MRLTGRVTAGSDRPPPAAGRVGFRTATTLSAEVEVTDGVLDIDLLKEIRNPKLSGLRLYALGDETAPEEPPVEAPPSAYLSFAIADTGTDQLIGTIDSASGDTVAIGSASPTLFAEVLDGVTDVASVVLAWNGKAQTENVAPYAQFGDAAGDFTGGALGAGEHTVMVEVWSGRAASGALLETVMLDFTLVSEILV